MAGHPREDTERALRQIVEEHQAWLREEDRRAAEAGHVPEQQAEEEPAQEQPEPPEAGPSEHEHQVIDFSQYIPPMTDFDPRDADWMLSLPTSSGAYEGGFQPGYSPGLHGSSGPYLPSFEHQAQPSSSDAGPSSGRYRESFHNPPVLPTDAYYGSFGSDGQRGGPSWQPFAPSGMPGSTGSASATSYTEAGGAGQMLQPSYDPSAGLPSFSSPYHGPFPPSPPLGQDPYGRPFHPARSTPAQPDPGVPQYSPTRPSPNAQYHPPSRGRSQATPPARLDYYHRPQTERPANQLGIPPGETVRSVVQTFAHRIRNVINYRQPKLLLQNTAGWTAAQRGEALAIFSEQEQPESSARLFVYTACLSPLIPATSSIRSEKGQRPPNRDFCDAYARASSPAKLQQVLDLVPRRGEPLKLLLVSDTGLAYTTAPLTGDQVQDMMQTSVAARCRR